MKRRKLKRRYFWKFEDGSILYLRKVRDGQDFESIGGVTIVGWNSTGYHADWLFLKDVMKARPDLTTRHVDKVLVMKN